MLDARLEQSRWALADAQRAADAERHAGLALRAHVMPFDNCIETMRQTGIDINHKYKETSLGGIAVNLPAC